ncbi:hypothetical protein Pla175_34610 [Pirellulimonas nuda]|uniref:Stigma-specific protein, Stig1 n=1 Tax=Pirellulimonas nuda TaxID=2528009 RepID=A0A518DF15_9BACT|nr:hypothetical protein [Pirellulimonas nuda]QDU90061.1 hypothetical protein Pla175_34610 [Pirellulimonas nuda]
MPTIRTALVALGCLMAAGCQIGAPCGCGAPVVPVGYSPGPADRCLAHLRREWLEPCGLGCGAGVCCGDACDGGCAEPVCGVAPCEAPLDATCDAAGCEFEAGCPIPSLLGACKIPHKEPEVPLPPGPPGRFFPAPTRPVFAPVPTAAMFEHAGPQF